MLKIDRFKKRNGSLPIFFFFLWLLNLSPVDGCSPDGGRFEEVARGRGENYCPPELLAGIAVSLDRRFHEDQFKNLVSGVSDPKKLAQIREKFYDKKKPGDILLIQEMAIDLNPPSGTFLIPISIELDHPKGIFEKARVFYFSQIVGPENIPLFFKDQGLEESASFDSETLKKWESEKDLKIFQCRIRVKNCEVTSLFFKDTAQFNQGLYRATNLWKIQADAMVTDSGQQVVFIDTVSREVTTDLTFRLQTSWPFIEVIGFFDSDPSGFETIRYSKHETESKEGSPVR